MKYSFYPQQILSNAYYVLLSKRSSSHIVGAYVCVCVYIYESYI